MCILHLSFSFHKSVPLRSSVSGSRSENSRQAENMPGCMRLSGKRTAVRAATLHPYWNYRLRFYLFIPFKYAESAWSQNRTNTESPPVQKGPQIFSKNREVFQMVSQVNVFLFWYHFHLNWCGSAGKHCIKPITVPLPFFRVVMTNRSQQQSWVK